MVALVASDLRNRYGRGRLRGLKWVMDPFAAVGVYLLLVAFAVDRESATPGLSIACAVVPFQLVIMTIANALSAIDARAAIIANMAIDTWLLPIASALTELIGFISALLLLALMMIVYGVAPTPAVLLLPVVVIVTLLLAVAFAFPAALIGTWFGEARPFVISGARALFFISPGIVALGEIGGKAHDLLRLNPLTGLFEAYRDVIMYGQVPAAWELAYPVGFAILLLAAVRPLWRAEQRHFAKVLQT